MIYILIGHRGSGKTSFLKKIKKNFLQESSPSDQSHQLMHCFDLDEQIVKKIKTPLKKFFKKKGEKAFRFLEKKTFQEIYKNLSRQARTKKNSLAFISVGAGFKVPKLKNTHILWIQRITDSDGRIFLNRPSLSPKQKSPLKEYFHFYSKRNTYFEKIADEKILIPEGFQKDPSLTYSYLLNGVLRETRKIQMKGVLTLDKKTVSKKNDFKKWMQRKIALGISFFELRDDVFSFKEIIFALKYTPNERVIFSFRKNKKYSLNEKTILFKLLSKNKILWDWPLEKGLSPLKDLSILSLHERKRNESVKSCILKFSQFLNEHELNDLKNEGKKCENEEINDLNTERKKCEHEEIKNKHQRKLENSFKELKPKGLKLKKNQRNRPYLKLSILISNIEELWAGHLWWLNDPKGRSFLPRSPDGSWSWYRLLHKEKMKINFFRDSLFTGSKDTSDQPFAIEWLHTPGRWKNFLALLGDPVSHSLTPWAHRNFSKKYSLPVVKILISKEKWTKKTLITLKKLKLVGAAVTSPLKEKIYSQCDYTSRRASRLKSINTLILKENNKKDLLVKGYNTDVVALHELAKKLLSQKINGLRKYKNIAVWGGGGVLSSILRVFPNALFFSSRSGEIKKIGKSFKKQKVDCFSPDLLIWGAPNASSKKKISPRSQWRPKLILDLSYTDHSSGKEYAKKLNVPYQSGLEMFKLQAEAQRELLEKEFQNIKIFKNLSKKPSKFQEFNKNFKN